MEGIEHGFVAQGIITDDEVRGSKPDLLQAYDVFKHAAWVSGVGNSNTVGSGPVTGRDTGANKAMKRRVSYE